MTPQQFIAKWHASTLSERSACHEHFLDLCKLLGQPTPAESDPEGAWYTFERGVRKLEGDQGWADVWMQDHFAWEYKGKHKDLVAAYKQLLQYREDLGNPPLLVVCDMDRFEVHTNFTRTAKKVYAFNVAGLAEPANLDILRKLFTDPDALRPGQTAEAVTEQASEVIGQVADGLRVRGIEAHRAAHFLMKLMFSMFAEDIVLLKNKPLKQIFATVTKPGAVNAAEKLSQLLKNLFEAMAAGGTFGADDVLHFNGGLFADADVIDLKPDEIQKLAFVNTLDWSNVEPSVFGTLFERILDPAKRSQIGAHYTSREDILTLLEPVMMQPLRREWEAVKAKCEALVPKIQEESRKRGKTALSKAKAPKPLRDFNKLIEDFHDRLTKVTVLDPACGSGNFLYVALNLLLNLEKEVITYASRFVPGMFPEVRPTQLAGIEINEYAQELASVVIWIGYLQWMHHNGFNPPSNPVLEPIETIRRMDAILDLRDPAHPKEPEWPAVEFIGQREAIADAARELDQLRNNWLNPPEWVTTEILEFPGTVGGPWDRYIDTATVRPLNSSGPRSHKIPPAPSPSEGRDGEGGEAGTRSNHPSLVASRRTTALRTGDSESPVLGCSLPVKGRESEETELKIGTVKYPRLIPRDETCAKELKKRTLTNLYNQRPAWLDLAHRRLDEAVFAAYGWSPDMSDDELLAKLLELNLQRAAAESS